MIDEELQNIGCSKLEMPLLLEKEDWVKSGRWTSSGEELFKGNSFPLINFRLFTYRGPVQDRHKRDYCLAPTSVHFALFVFVSESVPTSHEEAITSLVAEELTSFRQLPLRLYQIGTLLQSISSLSDQDSFLVLRKEVS